MSFIGDSDMATASFTMSGYQTPSMYVSVTPDGNLITVDAATMTNKVVGVSIEKFNQLQVTADQALKKAEEYHQKLVDAGLIVVPKTLEERFDELMQTCEKQSKQIAELAHQKADQDQRLEKLTALLTKERS